MPTLYETLGVAENATGPDIVRAYRRKAKEKHPDMATGNKEEFKQVALAYEVLSDRDKRERYDRDGQTEEPQSNFVSAMIGQAISQIMDNAAQQGADLEKLDLQKLLIDLFAGSQREFKTSIAQGKKRAAKLRKVAKRFSKSDLDGNNLLENIVLALAGQMENVVRADEEMLKKLDTVLGLVQHYSYKFDKQVQPQGTYANQWARDSSGTGFGFFKF